MEKYKSLKMYVEFETDSFRLKASTVINSDRLDDLANPTRTVALATRKWSSAKT